MDDSIRLMSILENESKARGVDMGDLVIDSQKWLWKNDGIDRDDQNKGLIIVLAGNHRGIPENGCVHCLQSILEKFPPGHKVCSWYQIKRAYQKAMELGRDQAAKLLGKHLEFFLGNGKLIDFC